MIGGHAIITGGSSGIGLAIARGLFAAGMNLTLVARREELLERARADLLSSARAPGQAVLTISADVAVRKEAETAVLRAVTALGPPLFVITSAGMARPGVVDELPVEVFERTMAVNYLGTVYVVKAALPHMHVSGARIVMLSSGAGLIGLFGYTAYSASKFALRGFAEALHAELRHRGIGVSIAFPPDTDTPQLVEESRTKPPETVMMTGAAGVWDADTVARQIIASARRGDFAITPGFELSVLYRLGSLLAPLVQRVWAWRVTRLYQRRGPMLARKDGR